MDEYRLTFIRNVQWLMDTQGMNQGELADKIGVSKAVISSWMTGARFPRMPKVEKLAAYFGVDKSDILGEKADRKISRRVPVISQIAAGTPIESSQDIAGWEEIPEELGDPSQYFILKVTDNSMYPYILEGARVIVHKQNKADNGQIAVVTIGKENASLKQITTSNTGITLASFDTHTYPPRSYTAGEIISLPITILGVAVEMRMKL